MPERRESELHEHSQKVCPHLAVLPPVVVILAAGVLQNYRHIMNTTVSAYVPTAKKQQLCYKHDAIEQYFKKPQQYLRILVLIRSQLHMLLQVANLRVPREASVGPLAGA